MTALVDASGVALERAHPPRRIVSLIPSTTETLCRLDLSDALVGVTAYCVEPREVVRTKTKVGGEKSPDLEATRALAPDLVIANVEEKKPSDHVRRVRRLVCVPRTESVSSRVTPTVAWPIKVLQTPCA
jgi:ABC-type Fe3+-hydroxamate transport system substrate-binding protein